MTVFLHQGGVVMSSHVTHKQSSNIHPFAHRLATCALIFSSSTHFYSLSVFVTAFHPSPDNNHQRTGGLSEITQGKVKMPRETHSITYAMNQGSHSLLSSPRSTLLIHSVYHIPFTSSISCHLRPQVLGIIHFLERFSI